MTVLLACAALCLPASAQELGGATVVSEGGAVRADPSEPATVGLSPATTALDQNYRLDLGARLGPGLGTQFQIGAFDSKTGPFVLGVAYAWTSTDGPTDSADLPGWTKTGADVDTNPTKAHTLAIGLARAWASRKVSLGAALLHHGRSPKWGEDGGAFDLTLSAGARPIETIVFALAVSDLVPTTFDHAPLQVTGAMRLLPSDAFGAEFDAGLDLADAADPVLAWGAGLVAHVVPLIPLRAGVSRDPLDDATALSAGVGVDGTSVALEYGAKFVLGPDALPGWHALSLVLNF